MILNAEFLYGVHERLYIFNRRVGQNAVTKVEHMSVAFSELFQDRLHALFDPFRRGVQHCRIEISLECNVAADHFPGFPDICRPIQADDARAGVSDFFEGMTAVFAEDDDRCSLCPQE